jgi:ribonuclease Z
VLFDLGDISALSARDLLKTTHVFVTHTHVDHFIGFDRLLRILLGRDKQLHLFGPAGILRNLEGKLHGYTWNLVDTGAYPLVITATEVLADRMVTRRFACKERFRAGETMEDSDFEGRLLSEPALTVSAAILDHRVPCLGLSVEERFHVHILAPRIGEIGAAPGPWLGRFKEALYRRQPPDSTFPVPLQSGEEADLPLAELTEKIARISPGHKIAYISDVAYHPKNLERIVELADSADHLFIEAGFLDADRETARRKSHLTARQAGRIARLCRARKMTIFHFSPRYRGKEALLYREAEEAFGEGAAG